MVDPTEGKSISGSKLVKETLRDGIPTVNAEQINDRIQVDTGDDLSEKISSNTKIQLKPNKVYEISSNIELDENIIIEGGGESTVLKATRDEDIFTYDGGGERGGITIRDLTLNLDKDNTKSTSSGVSIQDSYDISISNIRVENTLRTGINLTRCFTLNLHDIHISNCGEPGTTMGSGISVLGCSGIIYGCTVSDSTFGYNIQQMGYDTRMKEQPHLIVDSCDALRNNIGSIGSGFRIEGTNKDDYSRAVTLSNCYEEKSKQYGYLIFLRVSECAISSCMSFASGKHGFFDHGEAGARMNANKYVNCTAIAPGYSGFRAMYSDSALVESFTVKPKHPDVSQVANAAINAGPSISKLRVHGGTFENPENFQNGVATEYEPDDLRNVVFRNNLGYATEGQGHATGLSTDSTGIKTVTVRHKLDRTPKPEDIQVTLTAPNLTDAEWTGPWVSNIGSESFDIHLNITNSSTESPEIGASWRVNTN